MDVKSGGATVRGWRDHSKCGLAVVKPEVRDPLLDCVTRLAGGRPILFASDSAALVEFAKQRFGSQLLPMLPGEPRHTFRDMSGIRAKSGGVDPHLKQAADLVMLSATSHLMLTCGSYGQTAQMLSSVLNKTFSARTHCGGVGSLSSTHMRGATLDS
jgi:hypothetical protein